VQVNLVFARCDNGIGQDHDGQLYERLVLTPLRIVELGDRFDGAIEIVDDRVMVGAWVAPWGERSEPRIVEVDAAR